MDFAPSERQERVRREFRERFGRNLPGHREQFPPSDGELTVVGERILGLPKE